MRCFSRSEGRTLLRSGVDVSKICSCLCHSTPPDYHPSQMVQLVVITSAETVSPLVPMGRPCALSEPRRFKEMVLYPSSRFLYSSRSVKSIVIQISRMSLTTAIPLKRTQTSMTTLILCVCIFTPAIEAQQALYSPSDSVAKAWLVTWLA